MERFALKYYCNEDYWFVLVDFGNILDIEGLVLNLGIYWV
jgi:hypothetical protein